MLTQCRNGFSFCRGSRLTIIKMNSFERPAILMVDMRQRGRINATPDEQDDWKPASRPSFSSS